MRTSFRRKPAQPPSTQNAQKHLERPSAQDIYEQVANNARQELGRSGISLTISGLAGGIFMGLSAMGNAIAIALLTPVGATPTSATLFVGKLFYPLGFIVVILGPFAAFYREHSLSRRSRSRGAESFLEDRPAMGRCAACQRPGCAGICRAGNADECAVADRCSIAQSTWPRRRTPSGRHHLLVWRYGWLDHRHRGMAGLRIALDHRLGHDHLDACLRGWPGQLRPLHRRQRRESSPPSSLVEPPGLAFPDVVPARSCRKHLRRRRDGDATRVRPGDLSARIQSPKLYRPRSKKSQKKIRKSSRIDLPMALGDHRFFDSKFRIRAQSNAYPLHPLELKKQ